VVFGKIKAKAMLQLVKPIAVELKPIHSIYVVPRVARGMFLSAAEKTIY